MLPLNAISLGSHRAAHKRDLFALLSAEASTLVGIESNYFIWCIISIIMIPYYCIHILVVHRQGEAGPSTEMCNTVSLSHSFIIYLKKHSPISRCICHIKNMSIVLLPNVISSSPRYRLACICFPTPGRGLPYGSGLGLSRCLGPGECLHSFIHVSNK